MSKEFSRRELLQKGALFCAGLALERRRVEPKAEQFPEYRRVSLRDIALDLKGRSISDGTGIVALGVKPEWVDNNGILGRMRYAENNLSPFATVKWLADWTNAIYHPLNAQETALAYGLTLSTLSADGTEKVLSFDEQIKNLESLGSLIVLQTANTIWTVNKDTQGRNLLYQKSDWEEPQKVFTVQKARYVGVNLVGTTPDAIGTIKVWTTGGTALPDFRFNGETAVGGDWDMIGLQDFYFGQYSLAAERWNGMNWEEVGRVFLSEEQVLKESLIGTGKINNRLAFFTIRSDRQTQTFSYQVHLQDAGGGFSEVALTPEMPGNIDLSELSEHAQVLQPQRSEPILSGVFSGAAGYEKNLLVPKRSQGLFIPFIRS